MLLNHWLNNFDSLISSDIVLANKHWQSHNNKDNKDIWQMTEWMNREKKHKLFRIIMEMRKIYFCCNQICCWTILLAVLWRRDVGRRRRHCRWTNWNEDEWMEDWNWLKAGFQMEYIIQFSLVIRDPFCFSHSSLQQPAQSFHRISSSFFIIIISLCAVASTFAFF